MGPRPTERPSDRSALLPKRKWKGISASTRGPVGAELPRAGPRVNARDHREGVCRPGRRLPPRFRSAPPPRRPARYSADVTVVVDAAVVARGTLIPVDV